MCKPQIMVAFVQKKTLPNKVLKIKSFCEIITKKKYEARFTVQQQLILFNSTLKQRSNPALKRLPCLNEMTFNAELIKWPEARL